MNMTNILGLALGLAQLHAEWVSAESLVLSLHGPGTELQQVDVVGEELVIKFSAVNCGQPDQRKRFFAIDSSGSFARPLTKGFYRLKTGKFG